MPRKKIDIPDHYVTYLSILDETGNLDKELAPDISDDLLLKLYRAMLLGRRFDERMLSLQRQGRIGTFAPISGQEASQLGAVAALEASDRIVPSFRETAAQLWRGTPMENVLLVFGGFAEGARGDGEVYDLPVSVPVGSQVLHAVGLAWAMKYRKTKEVAMAFFGDGATSEGDFHEGLNFAAVYQVPAVFICQNNQWAISLPRKQQTRAHTLAQKALAYGMPGVQVDGNDVLAVYAAAKEAVERARAGGGPTMIECVTYRMMMHTTADDPKRYRTEEEVEGWRKRDPISRFQTYLSNKGLLPADAVEALESVIEKEIQEAVDKAEAVMKAGADPLDMFDHAYADMPPHIAAQKEELKADLASDEEENRG
ncbi:MAG: pyruvate dehydrogenase (acetyl-transferring) E1 component subunit alpha [Deltaproteobacteria bacterium]|nr:pyruvate dehydrogenase (acetyl-transferring) E1 component subunit alpha [Deltaproteobacteria bacterium]